MTTQISYCSSCGTQMATGGRFCAGCGAPQGDSPVATLDPFALQSEPDAVANLMPLAQGQQNDGKAVASLVLSLLWFGGIGSIIAVVLGHLSRSESRKQGRTKGGMALAGIIIGYAGVAMAALLVVLIALGVLLTRSSNASAAESALKNASTAELSYAADNDGAYTSSASDLLANGFQAEKGVEVVIISGDSAGFCLQAITSGSGPWYISSTDATVTTQPCQGPTSAVGADGADANEDANVPDPAVASSLKTASIAEESYATDNNGAYTTSLADLTENGLNNEAGVSVAVLRAGDGSFCLAGGPTGGNATAWLSSDDFTVTTTPCN